MGRLQGLERRRREFFDRRLEQIPRVCAGFLEGDSRLRSGGGLSIVLQVEYSTRAARGASA